jgi:integrase
MSRRSGQNGNIERRGNAFYVRFRIDIVGQEKRRNACVRICPTSGPGKMTKPERERRAKEIIAESGANTAEHFKAVQAVNLGVTFKQQAEVFMTNSQTRKLDPIKPATAKTWEICLKKWLNPHLGQMPISAVNNLALKKLVSTMAEAGLSAQTLKNYSKLVKLIVASAIDEQGEELYPRKWNRRFIDLPKIENQHTPTFTVEEVTQIIAGTEGHYRVLYALLAGSGLRIGEALGLEIGDVSADGRTLTVRQSVWNGQVQSPKTDNAKREVDLAPVLASMLRVYIGQQTSGMLFCTSTGRPISQRNILGRSLHPALETLGIAKTGFHAFRRFRVSYLRKKRVLEDLTRLWIGHSNKSTTDRYSMVNEDVVFRQKEAADVGLGFVLPAENPVEKPAVARIARKIMQEKVRSIAA